MARLDRRASERRRGNRPWGWWACQERKSYSSPYPSSPPRNHRSWCNASSRKLGRESEREREKKRERVMMTMKTPENSNSNYKPWYGSVYKLIIGLVLTNWLNRIQFYGLIHKYKLYFIPKGQRERERERGDMAGCVDYISPHVTLCSPRASPSLSFSGDSLFRESTKFLRRCPSITAPRFQVILFFGNFKF